MTEERNSSSWNLLVLKSQVCQSEWKNFVSNVEDSFFNLAENLDENIERATATDVVVAGPMIYLYLKDIGQCMFSKLGRGRNTGLHSSVHILLPWQIFTCLIKLIMKYGVSTEGATCNVKIRNNKEKLYTIIITKETCAKMSLHPVCWQQLPGKEEV